MRPIDGDLQLSEHEPPRREPGALGRILRIVDAGPRYFFRSALVSLALTALLAIPIAIYVRPHGPVPRPQRDMIAGAVFGLCLAAALGLAAALWPAGRRRWLDRLGAPEQRAAIWLSLTVWFPLLLIVVYLRSKATLPTTTVWLWFGYVDKRWVTGTYLLGVLAPMLFLVAAMRVLAAARGHPATWRAWLAALTPATANARVRSSSHAEDTVAPETHVRPATAEHAPTVAAAADGGRHRAAPLGVARVTFGVLTALAGAWYFYGPPWFLDRPKAALVIGNQEDVFLSGFQAISHGTVPYIGPAAMQYGPGAQVLTYWYMRHMTTFSVVGFRESWAVFQWAGASLLFVTFFLAFGYFRGLMTALLLALVYPPLREMGFVHGRAYIGFYGWSDALRYAGAISLILLLPAAIRRCSGGWGLVASALLGLVFGVMSYIAQENLIAGVVGALAVSALLALSGSAPLRSVVKALLSALAGFLVVWVPVLAYYIAKGVLGRFIYLYFLVPQAVAGGYSNQPYGSAHPTVKELALNTPWRTFFYAVPFILFIVALLVVVQFRPFRVTENWSRERITLAATVVITILLYQGALLRSDFAHMFGTLLVFPALVIMAATALPRLIVAWRREILVVAGVVIFAASFLLFPRSALRPSSIANWASAPLLDRQQLAAEPAPTKPDTMAGRRVGAGLASAHLCCNATAVTMKHFLLLMDQIHHIVGTRTTYVAETWDGYPGLVYFIANLVPAPTPIDLHTMVLTERQELAYLADFRARVMPETYALATSDLSVPEVRYFRQAYPQVQIIRLAFGRLPFYVLLRPR